MKLWLIAAFLLATVGAPNGLASPRINGDEDIYPISCVDFSGVWEADAGPIYSIEQKRCSWLRIHASAGAQESSATTTIIPDNKRRSTAGSEWTGTVRHRWNNMRNFGSVIETYKRMNFQDRRVTEVVLLEAVNDNLLLESVYRTIESASGAPARQEYDQRVFRRALSVDSISRGN